MPTEISNGGADGAGRQRPSQSFCQCCHRRCRSRHHRSAPLIPSKRLTPRARALAASVRRAPGLARTADRRQRPVKRWKTSEIEKSTSADDQLSHHEPLVFAFEYVCINHVPVGVSMCEGECWHVCICLSRRCLLSLVAHVNASVHVSSFLRAQRMLCKGAHIRVRMQRSREHAQRFRGTQCTHAPTSALQHVC